MENLQVDSHMNGKVENAETMLGENGENARETINEQAPKKKRGRKKKSETVKIEETPKKTEIDYVEITSRSGRKRKSVNYYALANPDIIMNNDIETPPKKITKKIDNEAKKNKSVEKKVETPSKIEESKETTVNNVQEKNNLKVEEEDTRILNSVGLRRESENDEEVISKVSIEQDGFDDEETYIRKEKTYRKTGNTTEMLNTLFSQVDFHQETDKNEDNRKTSTKKGPSKKGRNKGKTKSGTNSQEADTDVSPDQKMVTCAVCKKEIEKPSWVHHKQRYHNNLAWRMGEKPLDLTNMDLVKQILNGLYIAKKPFYCEKCDKSVKSVNGFLSHKSVCGKALDTVKVPCKYCDRKMLPVSLPSHIRHYHEGTSSVEVTRPKRKETAAVVSAKRKAAKKALKVIRSFNMESSSIKKTFMKYFEDLSFISSSVAVTMLQKQILASKRVACKYPNCNFECFSAEDLKQHLKFCVNRPENGYVCKHCLFVQLTIADIIYHIETIHGVVINEGEDSDSDSSIIELRASLHAKDKKVKRKLNVESKTAPKRTPSYFPSVKKLDVIFEKAYEWTLEFCEKYFCEEIPETHFQCLKKNWELMPVDDVEDYLPKLGQSCDVGFETVVDFQDVLHKDHILRKFNLFESYLENNGNSTVFCGGPINAISWLPTPFTKAGIQQMIAVATKNHPDDKYTNDLNYNEKCFIQFWNVGPLNNVEPSMSRPRLGFCLSFDHGPIWDLQWCPSNCFDMSEPPEHLDTFRRMGVLAVAGSDSAVYIYSIPLLATSGQFYNSRPVLKLIPAALEELILSNRKFYASRISWGKASGHKYLAVGYTNGNVAIYNLWSQSKILRRKDECDIDILAPYKSFQAHYHHISAIALYHLNDGCRWLLTGSYDRVVSLWDLHETSSPIQTVKRNIVNDAIWMSNWLCHVVAYDEASTIGQATSLVQQVRDFMSDPLYLFHCSAAITCLSGSDWLNGIIQGNAVGEIFATFPKQLMINLNWKYLKNKKLLFGYTTLVEKDKTVEERVKMNCEKEKALRNQLKVKTVLKDEELPSNKEVTHLDYNPHYYEYEPLVYHEVDAKYGLLFCDHKMNSYSDFPASLQEHMSVSSKAYGSSKPNIYPLQAINRIEFNPNRQASTYYLTGYQAGFVRLTSMRFLNKDPQIVADHLHLNKN